MTSRPFTQELSTILSNNLSGGANVFVYDGNEVEKLPAVVVGVESEERYPDTGLFGNYILDAFIVIKCNGYDDRGNAQSENLLWQIFNILKTGYVISCLDGLFHEGNDRVDAEDSTTIIMRLKAYTHRTD
jgi:hypothetical protein